MANEIPFGRGAAKNGDISIAYEVFGPATGKPLLLIMGIGMQMLLWHDDFCKELVGQGYQVARMDNRDVGLSTHLHQYGKPSVFKMIIRPKSTARYLLKDMAADAIAVLDDLGWKAANIVGGSLGGMIAQTMAIEFPERVRTLTSMMSSPSPRIGRANIRFGLKVAGLLQQPLHNREEAGEQMVAMFRLIGSPPAAYPIDEVWLRDIGARSYERAYDPGGRLRQQAAMFASGDRRKALAQVHLPALVIHGDADLLFRLKGGEATAAAIPCSRLVVYPGMGHGALPRQLWPKIVNEICKLTSERQ
jgi:pimeloyl-ACP methyl ester carboxylesterase